jgi:hypothetical protein
MKSALISLLCLNLLLAHGSSFGDTLLIDAIAKSPPNTSDGLPRPTKGMSMQTVKAQFGEPSLAYPRIGTPPITRWDYPEYSVFFEHHHVLTSVIHR